MCHLFALCVHCVCQTAVVVYSGLTLSIVFISVVCDKIHQLYSLALIILSWRCVLCPAGLLYLDSTKVATFATVLLPILQLHSATDTEQGRWVY
jgi:hypothetical protein